MKRFDKEGNFLEIGLANILFHIVVTCIWINLKMRMSQSSDLHSKTNKFKC